MNPLAELKNERMERKQRRSSLRRDIASLQAVDAIANQEGGKIIIKQLEANVRIGLEKILKLSAAPEMELRTAVIALAKDLNLLRSLKPAPKTKKLLEEELSLLLATESLDEEEDRYEKEVLEIERRTLNIR